MKKRGAYDIVTMTLVILVGLLIVFGVFFPEMLRKVLGIQETTFFEKTFLVRDMAITANTLYSSPGNVITNYDKDTLWFSYEFSKEEAAVWDKNSEEKTKYPIIHTDLLNFYPVNLNAEFFSEPKSEKNLKKKVKPKFAKINDDIIIDEEIKRSVNEIRCTNLDPIGKDNIILIDAGHGGDDDGIVVNNIKEKDITGSIGFSLYQSLGTNNFFTRDNIGGNVEEQIRKIEYNTKDKITKEVNTNNIGLIISIHTGSYEDDSDNVKAYYSLESGKDSQQKSKKLACEILNELVRHEDLEITGISVVGIQPEEYKEAKILVKDKIAILLEIGNLENQKSVDILTQPGNIITISNSIIKGLENVE